MITCGWCRTHYQGWQQHCDSCGGTLPPPPGMDIGQPPFSTIPRALPRGFALRTLLTHNFPVWAGLAFVIVGSLLALIFIAAKSWVAIFPSLFALCGVFMSSQGLLQAITTLQAYRRGTAARGTIHSITRDHINQSPKIKPPRVLTYLFAVGDQVHEGRVTTLNPSISRRQPGQPLWVLYLPEAPAKNTIYPPLR